MTLYPLQESMELKELAKMMLGKGIRALRMLCCCCYCFGLYNMTNF